MSDASQLLNLLRMGGPPPPAHRPTPPAPLNDLDRLFGNAFSNSHPSSQAATPVNGAAQASSNDREGAPSPAAAAAPQSISLLSLLQQMSGPPPAALRAAVVAPIAAPAPVDASSLVEQLFASRPAAAPAAAGPSQKHRKVSSRERASTPQDKTDAVASASSSSPPKAKKAKSAATTPPPTVEASGPVPEAAPVNPFTFVSPFDLLDRLPPPPFLPTAPTLTAPPLPLVAAVAPEPTSVTTPSATGPNRSFLASDYLTPYSLEASSSQQGGLSLPPPHLSPSPLQFKFGGPPVVTENQGEQLRIMVAEANHESLDTRKVVVGPVTLFGVSTEWEQGRRVGSWEAGIVYGTKVGKIRVIDRVTGARLLLKGHSSALVDLAVASVEVGGRRKLASVGRDSKLIVWDVPNSFDGDAAYERSVEIQGDETAGNGPRFSLVKLHSHFPTVETLAVLFNDGKLVVVDLSNKSLENNTITSDEAWLMTAGEIVETATGIVDFDFSADGTAFVVLSHDGSFGVHSTVDPLTSVLEGTVKHAPEDVSGVRFVAAPNRPPTALVVSSKCGTFLQIVPIVSGVVASPVSLEFVLPATSADHADHFGHLTYHALTQTFFVSNSLRGSIFALHLEFTPSAPPTAASNLEHLSQRPISLQPPLTRISHVLEVPSPDPLISFTIDSSSTPSLALSAIAVHPLGIHQLTFSYSQPSPPTLPLTEENVDRRMSLEASILVESLVEVHVDSPRASRDGSPIQAIETIKVEEVVPEETAKEIKLAGSAVNAAIKSMKEKKEVKEVKKETPQADSIANMWAAGGAVPAGKKVPAGKGDGSAEVLKELKKLEDNLSSKLGKIVVKEMEKSASKLDEERAVKSKAEAKRDADLVKQVGEATSAQVESMIKTQITSQVMPSLTKLVSTAVNQHLGAAIATSLDKTLPTELERLLARPDFSNHLARTVSTSIAPILEQQLFTVVNSSVDKIMTTVRSEMIDVRKEIVREQSGALESTEKEVIALRSDVLEVKAMLLRMESLLLSTPTPVAQVEIIRPLTPVESYEEILTNALQPSNEPSFSSLLSFISSSPPTRLESLFPLPTSSSPSPKITNPVVLSLAYRLSQVISITPGNLDDEGRSILRWIRKCITAMDGKDKETLAYTPRILEHVIGCLHTRGKRCANEGDRAGADEIKTVENYAKSQLKLFSAAPVQGFRR